MGGGWGTLILFSALILISALSLLRIEGFKLRSGAQPKFVAVAPINGVFTGTSVSQQDEANAAITRDWDAGAPARAEAAAKLAAYDALLAKIARENKASLTRAQTKKKAACISGDTKNCDKTPQEILTEGTGSGTQATGVAIAPVTGTMNVKGP